MRRTTILNAETGKYISFVRFIQRQDGQQSSQKQNKALKTYLENFEVANLKLNQKSGYADNQKIIEAQKSIYIKR